jgi:hypothetical protein
MKQTIVSMNPAANTISVTYSYFPVLERSAETLPVPTEVPLGFSVPEESLFLREGDYWVIRYQEQVAFLKATRGLHWLSLLLRHPGREFHVSELFGQVAWRSPVSNRAGPATGPWQVACLPDSGPILDTQAKSEYKRRLDDLRSDLNEAERFNDAGRAEQARTEMNALAEQLASAVGLGGRNRGLGSEAERARSAVTKRIKDAISKIGEAIPSLRRHLAAQIKTGYFCSYNLNSERPIAWRFRSFSHDPSS